MNIAIILYRFNVKGGTQRQAIELAQRAKEKGHTVTMYAFYFDSEKTYTDRLEGLEIVSLDQVYPGWDSPKKIFGIFSRPSYLRFWLATIRGARLLASLIRPDTEITNPHGNPTYIVSYYFLKKNPKSTAIWMLNTMPSKMWTFWQRARQDPRFRVPTLKKFCYYLLDQYEAYVFIRPHEVVVLDFADQRYAREYLGKKAEVVRSGLDIDRFSYVPRKPLSSKRAKILLSGIFYPHRRFEDAFEALSILTKRNYDLTISLIGDYTGKEAYYSKLQSIIKNRGIEDRVTFYGILSDKDFLRARHTCDIGVFPYHLQSWGLAVFEAMATGMPVVVSTSLGASEILEDRKTAMLVQPKSPEAIADAIEALLTDTDLYLSLSRNGRKFLEEHMSWRKYTDEMLHIFHRMLSKKQNAIRT